MKKFYYFLTNKEIPLLQKIYKEKEFQIKNPNLNSILNSDKEEENLIEEEKDLTNENFKSQKIEQSHFSKARKTFKCKNFNFKDSKDSIQDINNKTNPKIINKDSNHSINKYSESDSSFVKVDITSSKSLNSKNKLQNFKNSQQIDPLTSNENILSMNSSNLKIQNKRKNTHKSLKSSTSETLGSLNMLQTLLNETCISLFKNSELFSDIELLENSFYLKVIKNCKLLDDSKILEFLFYLSSQQQNFSYKINF